MVYVENQTDERRTSGQIIQPQRNVVRGDLIKNSAKSAQVQPTPFIDEEFHTARYNNGRRALRRPTEIQWRQKTIIY